MTLVFYDFEVFAHDWLVVAIDPSKHDTRVIHNDKDALERYYHEHSDDIWVGYNSRNYDQWILRAILCGFDAKEVNDWIIVEQKEGWKFSELLKKFPIVNYDVFNGFNGLKTLEAFMGNDIRETSVPFDIARPLTQEEIEDTARYCTHDVEQTIEVFLKRKAEFDSQLSLLKTFGLPIHCIGKTQAQLASIILGAVPKTFDDEWQIRLPETLELSEKYRAVADWFMSDASHDKTCHLDYEVAGVPHTFAWGGVHGAIPVYSHVCGNDEIMVMADVDQLYPSLMVRYDLLSRAVKDPERFEEILATSLRLKAEKRKAEREPYKRICNITYGAEGDPYNAMYDPLHRNLVCAFGQLLLLDLIDKIEGFVELIQSNTDGILIRLHRTDFDRLDDAVYEWESRTGLHMSFDYYEKIFQKDVNNYVAVDYEGRVKSKGAYVKALTSLDNDLPVVNRAVVDYIVKGVDPKTTIGECDVMIDFQKVVKVSSKYVYGMHNGGRLREKTFRVFASRRADDGYIGKCKSEGATVEKFANTPDRCFIDNGSMDGRKVPKHLDKEWYVELARKRIAEFGIQI